MWAESLLPEKKNKDIHFKTNKEAHKMDNKTCIEIVVYKPCLFA